MARFRDSVLHEVEPSAPMPLPSAPPMGVPQSVSDRQIGEILLDREKLTEEQVERVVAYATEHGVRFGDAAIALGFVTTNDVMYALAQQFHYPYAPEERVHQSPELVTLNQPYSPEAESFRAIRSQLMMRIFGYGEQRRPLALVSPGTGDGKSYFAANLAVSLAQLGGRTLVVDANLRTPRLHEIFGVNNAAGLSSILAGRAEVQVIQQVVGVPSLFVLPVGIVPPNPLELIERPAFSILMRELSTKFDYILVDTPGIEVGTDAQVVASRCGAAMVVARKDVSRLEGLHEVLAQMAEANVNMVGSVMIDLPDFAKRPFRQHA